MWLNCVKLERVAWPPEIVAVVREQYPRQHGNTPRTPPDLVAGPPNFECVYPTVNRGLPFTKFSGFTGCWPCRGYRRKGPVFQARKAQLA